LFRVNWQSILRNAANKNRVIVACRLFARSRQELAKNGIEYLPYLYATGLFDRAWPAFREPVERHVRPFIDGQVTLDRMTAELAQALP
jgi:hypothetical protein